MFGGRGFKAVTLIIIMIVMVGAKCNKDVVATPSAIVVPSPGYETIQKAINAANPGEVIRVTARTYYENLIVNKSVSIIGEDPANTVVDGGGNGNVITVIGSNVVVSGFTIQNGKQGNWPYCGISVFGCSFVVVNNTLLRDNYYGLQVAKSNNSKILNNNIMNSSYAGIYIHDSSSNNVFFENIIENNSIGLWGSNSPSNIFYHNNFVNNTNQWRALPPVILDNGAEGNYWSDYEGSDTDSDGIGDSPFAGDSYPLMGMFTNFTVDYETQTYFLSTICNSTISSFEFDESHGKISFDVLGPNDTIGFCRIAIPIALIQHKCIILVDSRVPPLFGNWTASTYGYRYFVYGNTGVAKKVTIEVELPGKGTPPSLLVPALIAVSLAAIVLIIIILIKGSLGKEIKSKFLKKQSLILRNYY
jgi:parallel beta-helix repeat protein